MTQELNVGTHRISNEVYQNDPAPIPSLTRGTIYNLIFHSPAHAFWNNPRLNPQYIEEVKTQFDIGGAAHSLLLEGIDCCTVINADDWRKKSAQEERDAARAEGKIPMLTKQYDEVNEMVKIARGQIAISELEILDFKDEGDSELSYIWKEDETYLRIRPDWIRKDKKLAIDYKTAGDSANPASFGKKVIGMGYDIQDALYSRGVEAIEGVKPKFVFVVQETEKPYFCSFVGLSPMFRDMGEQKVNYGIQIWNQCLERNEWPAYPKKIAWLEPPTWALSSWESIAEEIVIGGHDEL